MGEREDGPEGKPEWSFGKEGDYAVDRARLMQRMAALLVVAFWCGILVYRSGAGYAMQGLAFFLVPLACIWWPERMSKFRGHLDWRQPVDLDSHPGCLVWAAWIWLFSPLIPALVIKLLH